MVVLEVEASVTQGAEVDPPWKRDLDTMTAILPIIIVNPSEANRFCKQLYSQMPVGEVVQAIAHMETEEFRRQFRWNYIQFLDVLDRIGDPRDADLLVSTMTINLMNWFLKDPPWEKKKVARKA